VTSDPKRLAVVGATDLERSLLQAARRERPSPELTARMAAGLGISVGAALTAAPAAAAAAAPVAAAKTTLTAWLAAGALAAAVATGVVVARSSSAPAPSAPAAKPAAVSAAHEEPAPVAAPAAATRPERRIERARKHTVPAAPVGDLRDQIALIDAARTAVKAGSTERALVLLRRYETSYPAGAFRPEALALRIEALAAGGRGAEARALAREFLARYPQSPLADRVERIAR
jgi:hypothetical protein